MGTSGQNLSLLVRSPVLCTSGPSPDSRSLVVSLRPSFSRRMRVQGSHQVKNPQKGSFSSRVGEGSMSIELSPCDSLNPRLLFSSPFSFRQWLALPRVSGGLLRTGGTLFSVHKRRRTRHGVLRRSLLGQFSTTEKRIQRSYLTVHKQNLIVLKINRSSGYRDEVVS